jgi:hypothetical protein
MLNPHAAMQLSTVIRLLRTGSKEWIVEADWVLGSERLRHLRSRRWRLPEYFLGFGSLENQERKDAENGAIWDG